VHELLDLAVVASDSRYDRQAAIGALLGPLRHVRPAATADDLTTLRSELVSVLPALADLRLGELGAAVAPGRGDA
jgi:hypothetical protein